MRRFTLCSLILLVLAIVAFRFDRDCTAWFAAHSTHGLKAVASGVSQACDWPWLAAAGVVLVAITARLRRKELARVALTMLLASCVAGIVSNGVKSVTGRTRPNIKNVEQGWYGMKSGEEWLIGKNKYNSFPSSHTACASAFFIPLALLGGIPGVIGVALALLVGWARLQLGVHHLSDVCSALLLGWISFWVVAAARRRVTRWTESLCDLLGPKHSADQGPSEDRSQEKGFSRVR